MHKDREVVVTGLGVVTPLDCGKGVGVFWDELCKGENAIKPIRSFNVSGHKCNVAGEISGFQTHLNDSFFKEHGRCMKFFALACKEALEDSKINIGLENIGVSFGSILGDIEFVEKYLESIYSDKRNDAHNLLKDYSVHSIPAYVANRWQLSGPNISINTACSSGADAIGLAFNEIKNGRVDIMFAGGADVFSEFAFQGFSALDALTKDGLVRPFDRERTGLALSEGSGAIVLEEKEHAQKRKAKIYAKLIGFSSGSDAYNLVKPHQEGEGLSMAINKALAQAGIKPDDVDYINAHGTGTIYNDSIETKAIKRSFGKKAYGIKVSSIKSMIGHALGASAVIEAISCVKALSSGIIPPTINYETPDPECDLDYVVHKACKKEIKISLSLSAGFGGQNGAILLEKGPR